MPLWEIAALVAGTLLLGLVAVNLLPARPRIEHEIRADYSPADPQFARTLGSLLGPRLIGGNQVTPLQNGDEIFPAMLEAIAQARETITFETYIYWSGAIGRRFSEALCERAQQGVRVHVLLDWVGSGKMEPRLLQDMVDAGVEVERYRPLRWYTLARLNRRTHRKLLVVDGRIGFTGGVGIADQWLGQAQDPDHWRDSHFRVDGPAVAQMQAAFMDNWLEARATLLHDARYFPPLQEAGAQWVQVFKSSPEEGSQSVRMMYLLSIAAARESIRIANAYFVPDDLALRMLVAARARGVRVEIVVPGRHIDTAVTRRASRSRWGALLEAGAAIYEYQPTMYHTKVMIVDEAWVSVGSTNFDDRSFRLNDEANLNVLDPGLARELVAVFEGDKARARRCTAQEWRRRPLSEKLVEHGAGLLRPQL